MRLKSSYENFDFIENLVSEPRSELEFLLTSVCLGHYEKIKFYILKLHIFVFCIQFLFAKCVEINFKNIHFHTIYVLSRNLRLVLDLQ